MLRTLFYSALMALLMLAGQPIQADTLRIGLIFAKSGKAQNSNREHLTGAHFAVETLRQRQPGRRIELLEFDNHSSALGSKQAVQRAIAAGVDAIVGPAWSSHALAIAPLLQEAGIPMVTPTATNPRITEIGDYIFRTCYNDRFQGRVIANFAYRNLHARRVVVLVNASEQFPITVAEIASKAFEKLGGKVLWRGEYLGDAFDFRELLLETAAYEPDLVILPGYSRDAGFIIKQARALGMTVPFIGADGWSTKMYRYGGSAIDGNYFTRFWHPDLPSELSRDFVARYRQTHAGKPTPATAQTYDAVMLLADAWRRAGTHESGALRAALAATRDLPGVTGKITFDAHGDPDKSLVVQQFLDGDAVFVESVRP